MLEDLLSYQSEVKKSLEADELKTDWKQELKFFEVTFLHFQIERMIHLVVTMTVGLATLISCFASIQFQMEALYILDVMLIMLFFAYILHYRRLENTAQSWYPLLVALKRKILNE